VRRRSLRDCRGGLGYARLRRIKEFVDAGLEGELTLWGMAQSVELSTAHFSRMFRKSTGESPHRFVVRHRIERAKEFLRAARRASWTSRWPAVSKRSSISLECSAGCAESALQNIVRNFCATERLAFSRPAFMIRRPLRPRFRKQIVTIRQPHGIWLLISPNWSNLERRQRPRRLHKQKQRRELRNSRN
jgi:AraC-like DNA-binding protein